MRDELKFFNPAPIKKPSGLNICRGRIHGTTRQRIWDPKWCFYEIGIGRYPDAPEALAGVGFVAYSNNPLCGAGKHSVAIHHYLTQVGQNDIKFRVKRTPGGTLTMFAYFDASRYSSYPIAHAAATIAVLISNSFHDLNSLVV